MTIEKLQDRYIASGWFKGHFYTGTGQSLVEALIMCFHKINLTIN